MSEISQELAARMEAFCRSIAGQPLYAPEISPFEWHREARAIVALLPKPVDPDLIEARAIAAETADGAMAATLAGEWDNSLYVRNALAGIKRGRELSRTQSGEQ